MSTVLKRRTSSNNSNTPLTRTPGPKKSVGRTSLTPNKRAVLPTTTSSSSLTSDGRRPVPPSKLPSPPTSRSASDGSLLSAGGGGGGDPRRPSPSQGTPRPPGVRRLSSETFTRATASSTDRSKSGDTSRTGRSTSVERFEVHSYVQSKEGDIVAFHPTVPRVSDSPVKIEIKNEEDVLDQPTAKGVPVVTSKYVSLEQYMALRRAHDRECESKAKMVDNLHAAREQTRRVQDQLGDIRRLAAQQVLALQDRLMNEMNKKDDTIDLLRDKIFALQAKLEEYCVEPDKTTLLYSLWDEDEKKVLLRPMIQDNAFVADRALLQRLEAENTELAQRLEAQRNEHLQYAYATQETVAHLESDLQRAHARRKDLEDKLIQQYKYFDEERRRMVASRGTSDCVVYTPTKSAHVES